MHIFKTRLKCLYRNKSLLFWTLLFPIILSIFFNFAFAGLVSGESLKTIDVVIVDNEYLSDEFIELIKDVKINDEKRLFNVGVHSTSDAEELLRNNSVQGIIEFLEDQSITLTLNNGGINQTIIKTFLDEYLQVNQAITSIIVLSGGTADINDIVKELTANKQYLKEKETGRKNPNFALNYFYSLIGMALVYGGFWGTNAIINLQANLSFKGLRVAISPTNRFKLLLIYLGGSFVVHFLEIIILLLFLTLFLGVSFNSNIFLMLLVCVLGSITGISFGAFMAIALKKASEGVKVAITSITGVFGGFLAGMMTPTIKYLVTTKMPILGYINPVNVITDSLYSLYYFPTLERFYLNIIILSIMAVVFMVGTYLFFRRDSYESI